jgi:hypothetical protein
MYSEVSRFIVAGFDHASTFTFFGVSPDNNRVALEFGMFPLFYG